MSDPNGTLCFLPCSRAACVPSFPRHTRWNGSATRSRTSRTGRPLGRSWSYRENSQVASAQAGNTPVLCAREVSISRPAAEYGSRHARATGAEMPNLVIRGVADLRANVGKELGTSEWLRVDQARIDLFADATDDHQWIHVDAQRAQTGPWGGTIAHGFLTLSLLPALLAQTYRLEDFSMAVNYGLDRVRFPPPVPARPRIRASSTLTNTIARPPAVQGKITATVEIEENDKPACIAELLGAYYPA